MVCLQEQQTRRQEIAAREAVALTELRDRRALLERYLERSFDERQAAFEELFHRVDRAMDLRDTAALQQIMTAITALACQSPFRDLVSLEATRDALKRGGPFEI